MSTSEIAKRFFNLIDQRIGPFDRPFQFRVFPFDIGGALNFLTVGKGCEPFVTYVSWDLLGHPEQKQGNLGRYELLAVCDKEEWCLKILTNIGRQSLATVFEPGDTLDIGPWEGPNVTIQAVLFAKIIDYDIMVGDQMEHCGLLGCIGITRKELEFASKEGSLRLIEALKAANVYPRTDCSRATVDLNFAQCP